MSNSRWDIWKEKNKGDKVVPWDIINPKINKLSEEESQKRLDMCLSCDRLIKVTTQCKECGCFMNAKTKLPHAYCPIGKWGALDAIN
jgi:hypothetical protein